MNYQNKGLRHLLGAVIDGRVGWQQWNGCC